jgi:hypothetical protein
MLHDHMPHQNGINDVFRVGREIIELFAVQLSEMNMRFPSHRMAAHCGRLVSQLSSHISTRARRVSLSARKGEFVLHAIPRIPTKVLAIGCQFLETPSGCPANTNDSGPSRPTKGVFTVSGPERRSEGLNIPPPYSPPWSLFHGGDRRRIASRQTCQIAAEKDLQVGIQVRWQMTNYKASVTS